MKFNHMKRMLPYGLFALAFSMLISSCGPKATTAAEYLDFLYESMPLPDSLVYPHEYWEANVAKTLEVRERMGWDIPEREFRHFVLPVRVNNENLDDFRTVYADSLCARVEGMSIGEAALEINHWCHERATYTPSDGRTISPMGIIKSGLGRCGEESTFAVSALRAAGIPARQVYTPRWAHSDDNHAWVEVFVDGKWHFMGACEPEAVLDLGWFNSSVSRAMLLHTKAFGKYEGPEDVISRTHAYTEINVIKSYIPTRRTVVTVVDEEGNPVEGADVEFKIYNYAEFYTVAHYKTDAEGRSALDTGLGDIVVWAAKGDRFGLGAVSGEHGTVVLDMKFGERYSFDLNIVPPVEDPLPDNSTPEQKALNQERLARENAIREAMPHPRMDAPGLFLSQKDHIDVTQEVIDDAMDRPLTGDRDIDCPRVELEMLLPYRREIRSSGIADKVGNPSEAVAWVRDNIKIDTDRNPQNLRIPPIAVWRSKISDARSRDIFFVAFCRTLGFPSRLDMVTGKPQYKLDGQWVTVDFGGAGEKVADKGTLKTTYERGANPVKTPEYYKHYTVSRIYGNTCCLCEFSEYEPVAASNELDAGYYLMSSGTRLADGSVLAHVETFNIVKGQETGVPVVLRTSDSDVTVIGTIDAEQKFLPEGETEEASLLSKTGRGYYLLCITGERDEPSVHAQGLMSGIAAELNAWGRPVVVLDGLKPSGLDNAVFGRDVDGKVARMLLEAVKAEGAVRLPYIAVTDSFGRVVWFSQGYNTNLAVNLLEVIHKL